MNVRPFTDKRCACLPFQQSWKRETPGWCGTCGLPFGDGLNKAREVSAEEYAMLAEDDEPQPA